MKSLSAFLLGSLAVGALLVAFLFGRFGPHLRTTLGPSPGDVSDVGPGGEGWCLELTYEPLAPARLPADSAETARTPLEEALPGERALPQIPAVPQVQAQGRPGREFLGLLRPRPRLTSAPPDPVEVTGPELLGWHPNGTQSYVGQQVLDPDRGWVRDGAWNAWHENGERHEDGAYRDGKEHGPWRWWHGNGLPMSEGLFDVGQRAGAWRFWYENGQLQMEGEYVDGVGAGLWTHYYESGGKKAQGHFENGKLAGEWTLWTPRGDRDAARSGQYLAGVRVD